MIKKLEFNVETARALEQALAENRKNEAVIDYLAMMTDVEIPTEEGENEDAQSEV